MIRLPPSRAIPLLKVQFHSEVLVIVVPQLLGQWWSHVRQITLLRYY